MAGTPPPPVTRYRRFLRDVAHLRYTGTMKTTTIPSIRVEPDFRAEVEAVLADGETLSQFVEASVRATAERHRHRRPRHATRQSRGPTPGPARTGHQRTTGVLT